MCSQCEKEFFTDDWDILVALRTQLATVTAERDAARGFAKLWKRCAKSWYRMVNSSVPKSDYGFMVRKYDHSVQQRIRFSQRATEAEAKLAEVTAELEHEQTKNLLLLKRCDDLQRDDTSSSSDYKITLKGGE